MTRGVIDLSNYQQAHKKGTAMLNSFKQSFPVGDFTCTMIYHDDGSIVAEWRPEKPVQLSQDAMTEYRKGRYEFFKELAKELGASIGVVEV